MTDEQLLQLLKEPPSYKAPNLYDEELAELVSARGREYVSLKRKSLVRTVLITAVVSGVAAFLAGLAGLPVMAIASVSLLAYFLVGIGVGAYLAERVSNSFKNHQYDVTSKRLADAIWWNSIWYPYTYFSLFKCQNIEVTMLLREGRILELEVYTRFCMAFLKPEKLEKSRYVNRLRNNIWVGWLLSGRNAEAAEGFSSCDLDKVEKMMRPILLNNLALAQVRSGDASAAENTLKRAFAEVKGVRKSPLNAKLEYIQTLVYLQQDDLENAERIVEKTEPLTEKYPDEEVRAGCMIIRGRIRHKQGRFEESKLFFKNAIEIFSNCDNTSYLNLCFTLHYFAQMLMESGDEKSALTLMHKVIELMELYQNREERTCERIKQHLFNASKLRTASDLLTLSEREGQIELITTS
ncbi:MAG: tetratricopeptide repeat protein [Candidatus Melainabacteria bacterium]|nr:tetratricopeptide repeat protein [Candidatus Melainabacteria bacterium]